MTKTREKLFSEYDDNTPYLNIKDAFNAGYDSRQKEIDELKRELDKVNNYMMNGFEKNIKLNKEIDDLKARLKVMEDYGKYIYDDWAECTDKCDSWGHSEECSFTNVVNQKKSMQKQIESLKSKYEKAVTCLIVLKQILSSGDFDIVAIRNRINDLLKELE